MNWEQLSILSPESATEEEKNELYNTLIWFDVDSEPLDLEKCLVLFKISQEIMKYKGEQVNFFIC